MMDSLVRYPFRLLQPLWITALVCALALAIPRFIWMLQDRYSHIILLFIIMSSIPLVLLNKSGRAQIGLARPSLKWVIVSFFVGAAAAITIYLTGLLVFPDSESHWYHIIMNSFNKEDVIASIKLSFFFFLLFALPSMIFSPIGEELLFRGFLWLLMMATASMFYFLRSKSASVWGAVTAHAGFNLGMMACIVYLIH
ncbi:MAG: hypothetical protein ACOYXA_04740 [Bacteroidota bacterium]